MKRIGVLIGLLLLLVALGAAGWYFVSPLFLNRTVDEALPFALPTAQTLQFPADDEIGVILPPTALVIGELIMEELTAEEAVTEEASAAEVVAEAIATEVVTKEVAIEATEEITEEITAEATASTPTILSQGSFVDGDSFHKGSGIATLYAAPDGSYLLRFDDFIASNGPDLHVLLSPATTPTDHASLGDYLDLGALKGNIGAQNYALPADFDPTAYKSVVIYCLPFQVIFATATLE